jgi:hypothetical protein
VNRNWHRQTSKNNSSKNLASFFAAIRSLLYRGLRPKLGAFYHLITHTCSIQHESFKKSNSVVLRSLISWGQICVSQISLQESWIMLLILFVLILLKQIGKKFAMIVQSSAWILGISWGKLSVIYPPTLEHIINQGLDHEILLFHFIVIIWLSLILGMMMRPKIFQFIDNLSNPKLLEQFIKYSFWKNRLASTDTKSDCDNYSKINIYKLIDKI